MDYVMRRLIFVPQYPTKLRYQEWWITEFVKNLSPHFAVITLGYTNKQLKAQNSDFSPITEAIQYELMQIHQYNQISLKNDDILLLNDLSFPGLFANVLFHKRPKYCYAICHATSLNRYDYFAKDREKKYPIEKALSKLFRKVFVGSFYHACKLGWDNLIISYLPDPPINDGELPNFNSRSNNILIAGRKSIQKRTTAIEKKLIRDGYNLKEVNASSWEAYYSLLMTHKMLLSTAKEETYGYQVIDAIKMGCIPLVPYKYSYPEIIPGFMYFTYEGLKEKIDVIIQGKHLFEPFNLVQSSVNNFYNTLISTLKYE